ncbi:hypothetical protein OFC38_27495, partial [Escherichia coli]|nr:hypothetical protein [Escherichia coli]MCB4501589.1 hypothetical protein [Escherichia coli]MCI3784594.1 hypothetical protein [Escherichia coli]MCV4689906.1 hypothetical protein [Escherichia coli]MDB8448592.1 hypothetical protein [Escherichia coli]
MKINLLRGYLLSATQHGNKPPSRHEAESLKRVLTPKSWTVKHEAYRSDSDIQLESDLLISG